MRSRWMLWCVALVPLAGCLPFQRTPEQTQQVASTLTDPGKPRPARVQYTPASNEISLRMMVIKDKLIGDNPQIGLRPYVYAVHSGDPEIFHVGPTDIYITDALVQQCQTDNRIAAVLANELGRMVSEREARVADDIRQPERLRPMHLPIGGGGNAFEADPFYRVELAQFEKENPRHVPKLAPPNPQQIARTVLERAGFQRTDLDAAMPILQNAERFRVLQNQFNGPASPGGWKSP